MSSRWTGSPCSSSAQRPGPLQRGAPVDRAERLAPAVARRQRRPAVDAPRPTAAASRAKVAGVTRGMSTASTGDQVRRRGGSGRARRAARPPGHLPRVLQGPGHRTRGRDRVADDDDLDGGHGRRRAPAPAASRPSSSMAALSTPSMRTAVPPARTTAPSARAGPGPRGAPRDGERRRSDAVMAARSAHRAACPGGGAAWRACRPAARRPPRRARPGRRPPEDPVENRDRLAALEVPAADLVVLPEGYPRDFGAPGDAARPEAEALDGPFVAALTARAASTAAPGWPGCSSAATTPAGRSTPWSSWTATGLRASYRKIHLYDSFGFQESDRLLAGTGARRGGGPGGAGGADDLLRPAVPRAGARAVPRRRRPARRPGGLGGRAAQGARTGARW